MVPGAQSKPLATTDALPSEAQANPFCGSMTPGMSDTVGGHMAALGDITPGGMRMVEADVQAGPAPGTWTVTFRTDAAPGTLAAFAGALASARLDIISAVIRLAADGTVTDSFDVATLDDSSLEDPDAARLGALAAGVLNGHRDLASELRELRRRFPAQDGIDPRVEFNTDSSLTTGITVVAAERPGLLYDIASTLSRHGLRARAVGVLTHTGQAHDTFRVVDPSGAPPKDPALLERLRDELLRVVAE